MIVSWDNLFLTDADRARKHGLDEFVQANPCTFEHHDFFMTLQTLTLDYRLNDAYTCLVSIYIYRSQETLKNVFFPFH